MDLRIKLKDTEPVMYMTEQDKEKITEILQALIECGGATGVKGGQAILHFDGQGEFMGVNLNYWPWRKRKKE